MITLSNDLTLLLTNLAVTTASVVGSPPVSVTVGVVVYPLPDAVTLIEVISPPLTTAVAVAPDPPPPVIVTVGADVYPAPLVPTSIDPTLNL